MENYKGLCILVLNKRESLDNAFLHRFRFVVDFLMLDTKHRKEIWKKCFELIVPINDIDFEFLAQQLKISAGNIRNIILNAAFLAVADSDVVEMKHIIRATKREFNKIGKPCLESEFGPYYSMIK